MVAGARDFCGGQALLKGCILGHAEAYRRQAGCKTVSPRGRFALGSSPSMFAAVLTTFCFACSVVLARRSAVLVGSQPANLARQLVALALLAIWAHTLGQGWRGPGAGQFFLSGIIGFGLGDWALFE